MPSRPNGRLRSNGVARGSGTAVVVLLLLLAATVISFPSADRGVPAAIGARPAVGPLTCTGALTLNISASTVSGPAPLSVTFASNVSGGCPPYEVDWEFGDGGEATGSTVSHLFASAGYFHVQAAVSDSNDSSREASITIVATGGSGSLAVTIGASTTAGSAPLALVLWANVTGGNVSSELTTSWVFGDGGSGAGSPVDHTYLAAGTYVAQATVRDPDGPVGVGNLTIHVAPGGMPAEPNLSLSADPVEGGAPLAVTVHAYSNGAAAPYGLTVCFGDGPACVTGPIGWSGSTPFTVAHTFLTHGRFTVTGTLTNGSGTVVAGATVAVVVTSTPAVAVIGSLAPGSGPSPLVVELVASVSGGTAPYAVNWSFGDGRFGSSVPGFVVRHTYAAAGTYFPTVTVTDSAGHSAQLTVGPVVVTVATGFAGLPVTYGGVPTGILIGLGLGAAAAAGVLVGRQSRRRHRQELREEGEQLVRELEQQR